MFFSLIVVFLFRQHCDLFREAVQRLGYWLHGPGFETHIFLFSQTSRLTLRPTQSPVVFR